MPLTIKEQFYIEEFMLEYLLINDEIDDMHLKELTKFMEKNPNHQDFLVSKFLFQWHFSISQPIVCQSHPIGRLIRNPDYKHLTCL